MKSELLVGNDELKNWASGLGNNFFIQPDTRVYEELSSVVNWVENGNYEKAGVNKFLAAADCWVIAHAVAHKFTVVTQEIKSNGHKKVKIPNVCENFGVPCINSFKMLRSEGARFIL